MKYNKSDLNSAISEAHFAMEEIDNFDLDSSDAASTAEFDKLNRAHDEAVQKVIEVAKEL